MLTFVLAADPPGQRIVLYLYASTRNARILKLLLSGPEGPYRSKAVCNGWKQHDPLAEDPAFAGLKLFGCLTRCQRYYDRVDNITELPSGKSGRPPAFSSGWL